MRKAKKKSYIDRLDERLNIGEKVIAYILTAAVAAICLLTLLEFIKPIFLIVAASVAILYFLILTIIHRKGGVSFGTLSISEVDSLEPLFLGAPDAWQKYRDECRANIATDLMRVYVARQGNKIIGQISAHFVPRLNLEEAIPDQRVYFDSFCILPSMRTKGYGQQLLSYALEQLKAENYKEFTVGVEESDAVALHIYFKFGFTEKIGHSGGDDSKPGDFDLYLLRV